MNRFLQEPALRMFPPECLCTIHVSCGSSFAVTEYYDLNAKSPNPRHACMAVGERLYGVPQHEDEVVFKHHESPNAGTDCGSTECGAIRLNHSRCFWRVNHKIKIDRSYTTHAPGSHWANSLDPAGSANCLPHVFRGRVLS